MSVIVRVRGRRGRLHLWALRQAARTGHIRRASKGLARMLGTTDAEVEFPAGGRITVALSDSYWSRVVVGWQHEPEVHRALETLLRNGSYLLDCGANIGYWGAIFGHRVPVVAVEANPDVYRVLARHAKVNGFQAINAAVWSEGNKHVRFGWDPHFNESGSLRKRGGSRHQAVRTSTIDELDAAHGQGRTPVIKLDVEGAEVPAIEGAKMALQKGILIYEDHGSDRQHIVTKRLLDEGFQISFLGAQGEAPVHSASELDRLKVDLTYGYNLLARR